MAISVLRYHAVVPIDTAAELRGSVALASFREQIGWLARRGYRSLTLDEVADGLSGHHDTAGGRSVAITFDDGYRCAALHALPVLEEFGMTATLFVVTGVVGGTTRRRVAIGGHAFPHANWDELEGAVARGFAIGSQSLSHMSLVEAGANVLEDEIGANTASRFRRGAGAWF